MAASVGLPTIPVGGGEANISADLNTLAPLATNWHGLNNGVSVGQVTQSNYNSQNFIQKVGGWLGSVGNTVGNLASDGTKVLAKTIVSAVDAPKNLGVGLYELGKSVIVNKDLNSTLDQINEERLNLVKSWQSGKITTQEFNLQNKTIMSRLNDVTKQNQENLQRINHGQKMAIQGDIGTVGDVFAIATAGQSETISEATASGDSKIVSYLVGKSATSDAATANISDKILQGGQILDGILGKVNQGLDTVFTWNGKFGAATEAAADPIVDKETAAATDNIGKSLEPVVKSVADESQANAGGMATVLQRSRAVAVGLIIKRPLIYNTAVGQVEDLYKDFSSGNYGDAAKELGLLGLMTLAGGPVGAAIRYGGKATSAIVGTVFAKPQFFDELSGYIGTKMGESNSKALIASMQRQFEENPETAKEDAKALNIMAQTNIKAANGSVTGGVQRIINWYAQTPQDITTMTHDEVLQDLLDNGRAITAWQKAGDAGRLEGDAAVAYKQGRYAVGRISASDKQYLANMFKTADEQYTLTDAGREEEATTSQPQAEVPKTPISNSEIQNYITTFSTEDNAISYGQARRALEDAQEDNRLTPVYKMSTPGVSPSKLRARQAVLQAIQDKYGTNTGYLNSRTFMNQINAVIGSKNDTTDMVEAINGIKAQSELSGVPKDVQKEMGNYIPIGPKRMDAPYVHGDNVPSKISTKSTTLRNLNKNISDDTFGSQYFQKTSAGIPVLRSVGNSLTRMGLSPYNADGSVYTIFNNNLRENLTDVTGDMKVGAVMGENKSDAIVSKLEDFMRQPSNRTITDMRQIPMNKLQDTLGVSRTDAEKIAGAINSAMLKVPLELRGLGDRIVDFNYNYNPLAAPYARIQSAGKFAWNPFFKWQQVTTTEMFSQATAGGKLPAYPVWNKVVETIFPGQADKLNSTIDLLEQNNIFESGYSGYGAEDAAANTAAGISTKLLKSEKLSMAGLVNTMADKAGVDVDTYISQNPDDVVDMLRGFTQYPKDGNFINSPLARTINVAFFPARYNMKVAVMTAKLLAKQNPLVQVAVLQGLFKMNDFLKSNEGLDWIQKNSDAIQIFQWVSPLYSLDYTFNVLSQGLPEHTDQLGTYGNLGGLPFGLISQGLEAAGVINLSTPYVEPSTGEVIPSYIPKTSLGYASAALQGLVGSLFTYPGAVAGLPSKSGELRSFANTTVLGSNSSTTVKNNFNTVTPTNLSAQQEREAKIWSANNPQSDGQAPNGGPLSNQYQGPMVPIIPPEVNKGDYNDLVNKTANNEKSSSTKLKKGQFIPQPLPGQSQLGIVPGGGVPSTQ
jgi:hypothetical protein